MADFLLELGLEEIPARMIAAAEEELSKRVTDLFLHERLIASERGSGGAVQAENYATPRRLAILVRDVLLRQPDSVQRLTGPSWKAAFQDRQPTPAAVAFAKKAGVAVGALEKITTPKGEYTAADVHLPGRAAGEVLTEQLPRELAAISWPKSMYWRPEKPERFVRPLRWLVAMLDEEVVPLEFAGIRAGTVSYGHRILHGPEPVRIARPLDYREILRKAFVLADVGARRHHIRKSLDAVTRTIPGARWREDGELVEQVTYLTEWPTVLAGGFDPEFLELPDEVLVTVMRDHQKYFAVEDTNGKLLPHFLTVLNTQADSAGTAIIQHGNERVLRARFNDARFFWNYDQKVPLIDRVERLKAVTFQKDLGSYFTKTEINLETARGLAEAVIGQGIAVDQLALDQAVLLAKTDLTTELVKEFTELQGVVGGRYAAAQGLGKTIAAAISTQYLPASMDDPIPSTIEGQILGLADRMATIVEMFALGFAPSGSRDPFALRRAGNGVIKILAESGLPLTLAQVQRIAQKQSQKETRDPAALAASITAFFEDRLDFYLREVRGFAYDVVNAVLAAGITTVPDAVSRAQALAAVRGSEDMLAISTAFKRIKNILRQAGERGDIAEAAAWQGSESEPFGARVAVVTLVEPAEQRLHREAAQLAPEVESLRARQQYEEALERIAALRPAVDTFFDSVMVMTPEPELRRNRLALIAGVLGNFSRIADFSEITTP